MLRNSTKGKSCKFANRNWRIGFYDIPCLIKQTHVFEAGYAEAP